MAPGFGSGSVGDRATLLWVVPLPRELPFLVLFPPKPHWQSLRRRWFFGNFSIFSPIPSKPLLAVRLHLPGFLTVRSRVTPPQPPPPPPQPGGCSRRVAADPWREQWSEAKRPRGGAASRPSPAQRRRRARGLAPRRRVLSPPACRPYPACAARPPPEVAFAFSEAVRPCPRLVSLRPQRLAPELEGRGLGAGRLPPWPGVRTCSTPS